MEKKFLLTFLVIVSVSISGCVSEYVFSGSIYTPTNLKDIVDNPKAHLNEKINVIGILGFVSDKVGVVDYKIYQKDEQGYNYEFPLKSYKEEHRSIHINTKYKIIGVIKSYETCDCESRFKIIDGDCSRLEKNATKNTYFGYCDNLSYTEDCGMWIRGFMSTQLNWKSQGISLSSECKLRQGEYYECVHYQKYNTTTRKPLYNSTTGKVEFKLLEGGSFKREYQCNPNSINEHYYIEGTEPMIKL